MVPVHRVEVSETLSETPRHFGQDETAFSRWVQHPSARSMARFIRFDLRQRLALGARHHPEKRTDVLNLRRCGSGRGAMYEAT